MTSLSSLQATISKITTIPTLPTVITRISKLLQNPQTSAEEIGKVITTDQALTTKVLKLVNSAFYGFPGKIGTITHAIVILGFSTVANIVLTASILDVFRRKSNEGAAFDMEKFWLHSIATGAAAQAIAKFIGSSQKEECFIAGLIHDIGKIILCQYQPAAFDQVLQDAQQKQILFYESEKAQFDVTHQEIGGMLAEHWNLPAALTAAIKYHHIPSTSRDFFSVTAIVHCADIFVRAMDVGNGGDEKIPCMAEVAWNNLGLENVPLPTLIEKINDEIERSTVFLQMIN
ncbi:MAG: HDOD domain-containing protein [Chitinivibrionales bacterium]|nr:HDOD domain-containing protein [Chitinivibrionales bacterium]